MTTTIVIPCYNEAERLDQDAFARFHEAQPNTRLIFVDDGSRDETLRILEELAPRVGGAVVALSPNGGKAEAVRAGVLRALEDGATTQVGYWDADLATALEVIPQMEAVLEDDAFDVVIAARVQLLGRHIERDPLRHYAGRVFATFASTLLQMPVYDTQCGAKLFRVNAPMRAAFAEPFVASWAFDVELLSRLATLRSDAGLTSVELATYEFPLLRWRDVAGSKVKPSDFPKALGELGRIWLEHRNGYRGPGAS
ncbi:MAG: dolichyl-phosphate beta-glucosyltransferase [Bradymonadia bacterium]|jgi:dolichyl-phosphate beta-glucosyltransferase